MLTLDVMNDIRLARRPLGQVAVAYLLLAPNYHFPWTKTNIVIEGREHLLTDRPVIFAMNHPDRYNYWPFQFQLFRDYGMFTTTWVKGKYFNHPAIRRFMVSTANLPVPSRGYLISTDALGVLGRAPSEATYRLLRDAIDAGETNTRPVRERAAQKGVLAEILALFDTPRDMLGVRFDPTSQNYFEAMTELFHRMMDRFVTLNEEAFALGLNVLVFPEGTRSVRLGPGHTGLAQMALRLGCAIIPVGCNGSHEAYAGDRPLSSGGDIVYRIGEPLLPEGELSRFRLDEPFRPFSAEAEAQHGATFRALTDLVMDRINDLLDERHRRLQ